MKTIGQFAIGVVGALSPKRVVLNDPDYTKAALYQMVNNDYSTLEEADIKDFIHSTSDKN